MNSDIFIDEFLAELKSYAPVVLPTLFIYALESGASLKLWHAVKQLPHHEKEVPSDDCELNISAAHQAEIVATRAAAKKEARRSRLGYISIALVLLAIATFEQFVALKGMLNQSRDDDDNEVFVPGDVDDSASEMEGSYSWYYNSTLGQIDWTKSYYAITLFLPATLLTARALYLLSGLKERAVLRDAKGVPFVVSVKSNRLQLRRPRLVVATVILSSTLLAAGALWFRSAICSAILFASLIHFMVSNANAPKTAAYKEFVYSSVTLASIAVFTVHHRLSLENSWPIHLIRFTPHIGDMNWSALIVTMLVCVGCFSFISFCYRVDHAFARPDELLVGQPDIKVAVHNAVEVQGTRLAYAFSRFATSRQPYPRFKKPYFHTAVLGWLATYAIIAAYKVMGYIDCEAESAGTFALYMATPLMCTMVLLRALTRGEVKKLWQYKEDWASNPADVQDAPGESVLKESRDLEEKPIVAEVDEKSVIEA